MTSSARRQIAFKLFRFAALSIVSFIVTISLTSYFVEVQAINKLLAHAITLICVFFLNFAGLILFVFPGSPTNPAKAMLLFLISTIIFRGLEWSAYATLVQFLNIPYQLAIIIVVPVFALLKFGLLNCFIFNKRKDDLANPISVS